MYEKGKKQELGVYESELFYYYSISTYGHVYLSREGKF